MNTKLYNISQEFVAACHLLDVAPEPIVKQMGLPADLLENLDLNLSPLQVATAFHLIITAYGRDDFHIRLADGFAKAAFGHAFLALQCSETLRKGIHRVAHFKQLIEPVDWRVSESHDTLSIEIRALSPDFPLVGIVQIMSFLWLVKSCRNVTAKNITPSRVLITDAVPHQTEIESDLGCPITLGNKAVIDFPVSEMDLPILSFNRHVIAGLVKGSVSASLAVRDADACISSVRTIVLELLPSGAVTLERVAARLAMSTRTLERRLRDRGNSFTKILQECRLTMAQHYVHETKIPATEISLLLGYRETNSFYRAFREWFGCSPQQARERGAKVATANQGG